MSWLGAVKVLGKDVHVPSRESLSADVTSREGDQGIAPSFDSLSTSQDEDNDAKPQRGRCEVQGTRACWIARIQTRRHSW